MRLPALVLGCFALAFGAGAGAIELTVRDNAGTPVAGAMVTRASAGARPADTSDNGYPAPGVVNVAPAELTRFSDGAGRVRFPDTGALVNLRVRKPGYADTRVRGIRGDEAPELLLVPQGDPRALAEAKPANLWLSLLDFDGDAGAREHFLLHCAFCHQQASPYMRKSRSREEWRDAIDRMNRYGAQMAHDFRQPLARYLNARFEAIAGHPELLPDAAPWGAELAGAQITEWPIGDSMSQMHDFLLHPNGMVYVGDNLMDRVYELDPLSGEYRVYRIPHADGAPLGGILGNRFAGAYPKVENYLGVHSFALSPSDGHIFITPSMAQSLLEFDPVSKRFTEWKMNEGYYPHTIRVDAHDRVWFTLALSNQVAMFDRATREFSYFDLSPRSLRERVVTAVVKWRLGRGEVEEPPEYDWQNTGFPMPYGIDVAPDGTVWVTRLYAGDIVRIDPETGETGAIPVPFSGPRRLRCDAAGNPWITGFSSGLIARYDVAARRFDTWPLPVASETPYALNVDRARNVVWVNGNQSDTLLRFDIATATWKVYPLSRQRSFTRDIEIDEDGAVYTSVSNFPAWQIEDGQPTLIRLQDASGNLASP